MPRVIRFALPAAFHAITIRCRRPKETATRDIREEIEMTAAAVARMAEEAHGYCVSHYGAARCRCREKTETRRYFRTLNTNVELPPSGTATAEHARGRCTREAERVYSAITSMPHVKTRREKGARTLFVDAQVHGAPAANVDSGKTTPHVDEAAPETIPARARRHHTR